LIERKPLLSSVQKVVVKVGTGVIYSPEKGLAGEVIENLVGEILEGMEKKYQFVLVSSGAIGAGYRDLGLSERPRILSLQQAASAIGQIRLISTYDRFFREKGKVCAQILLTREDVEERKRFLNARNTFLSLLKRGIVPIVNENDTVATEEIRFGDNDTLSALVAMLIGADLLIILTDQKGLFSRDPRKKEEPQFIPVVERITPEIEEMASSGKGEGGMVTKIQAAKMLNTAGIPVVIAEGREKKVITRILEGEEVGTLFIPCGKRIGVKKHWIAYHRKIKGKIYIDEGAKEAILRKGKSLLPSGIVKIEGNFSYGDTISIRDEKGLEVARGLVNYSWSELEKIKGCHSSQIEEILGYRGYPEVVHRDNLVVLMGG